MRACSARGGGARGGVDIAKPAPWQQLQAVRVRTRLAVIQRVASVLADVRRVVPSIAMRRRHVAAHARAGVAGARVVLVAREVALRVGRDVDGVGYLCTLEDLVRRGTADALGGRQVGL